MQVKENRWLHRFAVLTAIATFLLVIAGGLVTSTDSGLAVPDWPLSYGQLMPPMVGGIFYEHGHRIVATFVGFLTTVLAIWLWRVEDRRWVRNLGLLALAAVITQGILGGLTVLFLLPTPISVAHATLAQSFFSLMIVITLVTSAGWREEEMPGLPITSKTQLLAVCTTGVIFVQLILGAWMRHSQAGLAIPDFPLSYGQLLPPLSEADLVAANDWRAQFDLGPIAMQQAWIHFAHRLGALLVTIVLITTGSHVLRNYRHQRQLREPALLLLLLLAVQVFLGASVVWTGKSVAIATGHVATGALMLGTSVLLTLRVYRLSAFHESETEYSIGVQTIQP